MVVTPWGDAGELRGRKLPPGRGAGREEVARSQRERLFGATVAVVETKGYEAMTVADLLELSGVSRASFYKHFSGKQECFEGALDAILDGARTIATDEMRQDGPLAERAQGALRAIVEQLIAQPAAARLCLVEAYAAGPAAIGRVDEAMAAFQELTQHALEEPLEGEQMPGEMVQGMVGGLRKIVHTRLRRGDERELLELVPDLVDWGLSCSLPPAPLKVGRRRRGSISSGETATGDAAERIIRATMDVVAEKGFQAATIADIAKGAGASLSTFYANFDDKRDAFDAALYSGRTRMLGAILPAYRRARNWPEAVRAVTRASLAFLAEEPEFSRLITVDVYAAGPDALERRDRAIEAAQQAIDEGLEYAPEMKPIVREAIISTIYAMLCDWVRTRGVKALPELAPLVTYMALVPFLGADAACRVANGEQLGRQGLPAGESASKKK